MQGSAFGCCHCRNGRGSAVRQAMMIVEVGLPGRRHRAVMQSSRRSARSGSPIEQRAAITSPSVDPWRNRLWSSLTLAAFASKAAFRCGRRLVARARTEGSSEDDSPLTPINVAVLISSYCTAQNRSDRGQPDRRGRRSFACARQHKSITSRHKLRGHECTGSTKLE